MIKRQRADAEALSSPDAAGLLQDQAGYCHAGKTKDGREHDVVIASSAIK
jgi:hypothetical protein